MDYSEVLSKRPKLRSLLATAKEARTCNAKELARLLGDRRAETIRTELRELRELFEVDTSYAVVWKAEELGIV